MASILRYIRYVKRLNEVGWKVTFNQQTLITGRKFILQNNKNLLKSYATAATQSKITIYTNNMKFHQFEDHVKRQGKISKSDIRALIHEIEELGNVSSLDGLLLIRSCGRALYESDSQESIKLVQEIWNILETLQTPIDISHYNALLSVYIEKRHDFVPDDFLKFMKEKGVEPNRVTYQRLMKKYCQNGNITGATKILEIMKGKGMPLNEEVFNSLILGYSESNDMENVLKMLDVMKTAGIPPSADSYTEVMCAYAKKGDLESILETLSKLSQNDIAVLDLHYLDIFYTLAVNGHEEKAETFLKDMPSEIHSDSEVSRYLNKLVFANHIDLSLKLLTRTSKNQVRQKIRAMSFIRAIIYNKIPIEKIVEICRYFDGELQYNRAFQGALYQIFLRDPKVELAFPLMKAWKETGGEIKEHYFWPLLIAEAKIGNMSGIANIVKSMIEDYKIIPTEETLKNYILPYMFGTYEHAIISFQALNIPEKIIYNAIADRLLIERKFKLCATFVSLHPALYSKDILLRHLVEALNIRDDIQSFTVILRYISDNSELADPNKISTSLVDAALRDVMDVIPEYRSIIIIKLLDEFVNAGFSISPEVAAEIRSYLNNSFTDDVEENLQKLSSGTLDIVPMEIYNQKSVEFTQDSVINMKKILDLRQKFTHHMQQNNVEEAYDTIQTLQAAGYHEIGIYAQAMRLFYDNENLVAAESCITFLKEHSLTAKMDLRKLINYANLLIKNNRFDDAIEFLKSERDANESEKNSKETIRDLRYLLETAASQKNVENLNQLFNLLHSKHYIEIDNLSLGPLVKIHILRGENDKAVEIYKNACYNHKCTPYKNMLMKTLIEHEDTNSLQTITNLSSEIYGESNALVDLAFCFMEFGKLKQAQKIFETPGLRIINDKIITVIEHYEKFNKIEALSGLISVTKSVARMDRSFLYDNILKLYNSKNDWEGGLALWTDMQEENIQPSLYFLNVLDILLQKNNQKVPFVIDSSKSLSNGAPKDDPFNIAMEQKNYDYAEKLLNSTNLSKQQTIFKYNNLIMSLLEHNELNRAYNTAITLIDKYRVIDRYVFNELSFQLIEARRFQDAKSIGASLNREIKNKINYWKVFSHAEIAEKGIKHFIESLQYSNENVINESHIHFGAIVQGLINNPEYINEYEVWAKKMWDLGIPRAMHALWNYYFIINDKREAQIFDEYVSGYRSLLIKPITQIAIKKKDIAIAEKLIEKISKMSYLVSNIRAAAYSDLIKVYLSLNRPEDALTVLRKYTKYFNLNNIPKKLLIQLQDKYEMTGKKFPMIIGNPDKASIEPEHQNSQQENKRRAQAEI